MSYEDNILTRFCLYGAEFTAFNKGKIFDSGKYHIYRVSSNDRYEKEILPSFENKTMQVPGQRGKYYLGSRYTEGHITIPVAYQNLSFNNFTAIKDLFTSLVGSNRKFSLIFDDQPWKRYLVYIEQPPQFNYLAFDKDGETIINGEGSFQFICCEPFSHSTFKFKNELIGAINMDGSIITEEDYNAMGINLPEKSPDFDDFLQRRCYCNIGDVPILPLIHVKLNLLRGKYVTIAQTSNNEIINQLVVSIDEMVGNDLFIDSNLQYASDALHVLPHENIIGNFIQFQPIIFENDTFEKNYITAYGAGIEEVSLYYDYQYIG